MGKEHGLEKTLGFIFDLDGTLVDSSLNFDAIRGAMGLGAGASILEELERMDPSEAERCHKILELYELEGAKDSSVMPGVHGFLEYLDSQNIRRAVITRNSLAMTELAMSRCGLSFDTVITRESGPVKPDPWGIQHVCELWELHPKHVVMVGDFRFDIEAGRLAGAKTVLFTQGRSSNSLNGTCRPDFSLESFERIGPLLDRLGIPGND